MAHAVLEISSRRPALCISGINDGENLGATNLISGTVGGAAEAAGFGIPSLAVSIGPEGHPMFGQPFGQPYCQENWSVAAAVIRRFASLALRGGLPPRVDFLNINIPWTATGETEIRTTSQSRQNHYVCTKPGLRDFSTPLRLPVTEQIDVSRLELDR